MFRTNTTLQLIGLLIFVQSSLFAQVSYTAYDSVPVFSGPFRAGINLGYQPNWTNEQLAIIGAGDPSVGQLGAGARAVRPGMFERVLSVFGYDILETDFLAYDRLGYGDVTAILDGPSEFHRDFTNYCPGQPSAIFRNIYLPIWDGGANGTPYNDDNFFAAYVYNVANTYKDQVTFWEVWNEPGFDFSRINGRRPPGEPNNWWDNDPNPCDYQLRAPIQSYVRMLRISYEIIKTVDPESFVTLGDPGFPSFLDAVLRNTDNPSAGAVTPNFPKKGGAYFDAVSIHAYPHFDFTAYDPFINLYKRHSDGAADGMTVAKNRFADVLENYGFDGSLYPEKAWIVTEANVPRRAITGPWMEGVELQTNYLLKMLMQAKATDIAQVHVYELFDNRSDAEAIDEFDLMGLYGTETGVLPFNQVANPQAKAMKTFTDLLFETEYDAVATAALNLPTGVRGYAFLKNDGAYIYALWAETTTDLSESATASYAFPSSLGLDLVNRYAWDFGYSGQIATIPADTFQLTQTPLFFEKNTANICSLTPFVQQIRCNDNGTDALSSDDIFSFDLLVDGNNTSGAWSASFAGKNYLGQIGTALILDSLPISGENLLFSIQDTAVSGCAAQVFVAAPPTCSSPPSASYCLSGSDFPWHDWIAGVEVGSIANVSSKNSYSDFTGQNTTLTAGQDYPITLTTGYSFVTFPEYWRVWIDFDQDNNFETNELVFEKSLQNPPPLGVTTAELEGILQIPAGVRTGSTRMRVSMRRGSYPSPCGLIPFGEVEDYLVTILPEDAGCTLNATVSNILCTDSGTPNFGGDDLFSFQVTVSGTGVGSGWVAANVGTTVSGNYGVPKLFSGYTAYGSAVTLQLQDLENSNCATTVQINAPGPCSNGGGTGTYCASSASEPWIDWIAKVKLGDLEWLSGKSQYSDFLAQTITLEAGQQLPVQLTTGFSWENFDEYWRVWIDFDKNGVFDASEMMVDSLNARPGFTAFLWSLNSTMTIPANAEPGVTRMRVAMRRNTAPLPCGTYNYGEVEDYSVNIVSNGGGGDCSIFAQQSNLSCQDSGTPSDPSDDVFTFNLLVNGANTGAGWRAKVGSTTYSGLYGQAKLIGPFPISGGAVALQVRDQGDTLCQQNISVTPPATCSNQTGPCNASSNFPWHDWIAGLSIRSLNSPSGKSQYSDFTAKNYPAIAGNTDTMRLTLGFSWFTYDEYVRVWIDFDKNGIYSSAEMVWSEKLIAPPNGSYEFTYKKPIAIPSTALAGATTMRVIMRRDTFPSACGSFENGEVEDYGVIIAQSLVSGTDLRVAPENRTFEGKSPLLFPQPAGRLAYLAPGPWADLPCTLTILDLFGRVVQRIEAVNMPQQGAFPIPLEGLRNGSYLLRIESPGRRAETLRLIVVEEG